MHFVHAAQEAVGKASVDKVVPRRTLTGHVPAQVVRRQACIWMSRENPAGRLPGLKGPGVCSPCLDLVDSPYDAPIDAEGVVRCTRTTKSPPVSPNHPRRPGHRV